MRKLVYALIRRRIRTLYPDPLILDILRNRGFQAVSSTVLFYIGVFILMSRIEIEPTRRVDLYSQAIEAYISMPIELDRFEDLPAVARSESADDSLPDPGEGFYTENTGPALEQIDSGAVDSQIEENDADNTQPVPPREAPELDDGLSEKLPKNELQKLKVLPDTKLSSSTKPKPSPDAFAERALVDEVRTPEEPVEEPTQEQVVNVPDEPVVSAVLEPEVRPDETAETSFASTGRRNITPAYVIDRLPRIVRLAPVEFPPEYADKEIEHIVVVSLFLDARGEIIHIQYLQSDIFEFRDAATGALFDERTEIEPAYVGDLAVPCAATVTFSFRSRYEEAGS